MESSNVLEANNVVYNKERVVREIEALPEPLLKEVLHFILFLKTKIAQDSLETALLSEPFLGKDWMQPEEDKAWRNL